MKNYLIAIMVAFAALCPMQGFAARGDEEECEEEYEINPEALDICTAHRTKRDGCDVFYSCLGCDSGYVLVDKTWRGYDVSECVEACTTANCASDSTWTNGNTGYQYKTNRVCSDGATCNAQIVYRCSAGYYGTSTNGASGCTRCPTSEDNVRGTSVAGATAQTNCYIPSGTSFSNTTGSGTYTGNSYYCN